MAPSIFQPARNNNSIVQNSTGLSTPIPSSPISSKFKTSSNNKEKSESNTIINNKEHTKSDSFIDDDDTLMSNTSFDSNDISMWSTNLKNNNTSMSSSSVDIQPTTNTTNKRRSPRLAPRYANRRSKFSTSMTNDRMAISPIIVENKKSPPTSKTSSSTQLKKPAIKPTFTPKKKQLRKSPCLRSPVQKELADRLAKLTPRTPCGCGGCKGEREKREKLL